MFSTGLTPKGRKTWQRRNSMHVLFDQNYTVDENGCWIWNRHLNGGYGVLKIGHDAVKAHRYSYVRTFGPIPKGAVVRHECDRTSCVNPSHLRLGTQADNVRDAVERGRARGPVGIRNPKAKLTEEQVLEIRQRSAAGETAASLSRHFGVVPQMVSNIVRGLNWKHVSDATCL